METSLPCRNSGKTSIVIHMRYYAEILQKNEPRIDRARVLKRASPCGEKIEIISKSLNLTLVGVVYHGNKE